MLRFRIMSAARPVLIRIIEGDVLKFEADVLVLKYAQQLFGADSAVYGQLSESGLKIRLPKNGTYTLLETQNIFPATRVLFVGVASLGDFSYLGVRLFAQRALAILAKEASETRHLAITLHGPGYGLDEQEAFESEIAGFIDALTTNDVPRFLEKISFVESNPARADRLQKLLGTLLPSAENGWRFLSPVKIPAGGSLRTAGQSSADKQHVFVAMPFIEAMDDIFHYGIESAVKAAGMLCERADLSIFAGDIMDWVRQRIETSTLIIADLTTANPNVYLEVGYAWGRGIPTVLLSRDPADLKFDVRGQRCLIYKSIRQLEEALTRELKALSTA
jgi:hypothetical protein